MALRAFKTARAVLEATRGTAGTPTRILQFTEANHEQVVETIRPESLRSSYFGYYSAIPSTQRNEFRFSGDLDYSMGQWLGQVFIKGGATAVGTSPYYYTYTPSGTADDLKTATLQFGYGDTLGSGTPAWQVPYCAGEELTLSFSKTDGRVTYDARLVSPATATQITAWTGSPTMPSVQLVQAIQTQAYFDTATIGSTADNYFLECEFTLTNGFVNLQTLNASAAAVATFRPMPRKWTARIRRYYINDTLRDLYESKAECKVRVKTTGPTLGTATYTQTLDLYGVLTAVSWAEVDGLGVEEYTLEPYYDTTATTDFSWIVSSADATVT